MQKENNIVQVILLTDIIEFTMRKEIMTQEELNIIHSCGFFLKEYFTQDKYIYYTFRRRDQIKQRLAYADQETMMPAT